MKVILAAFLLASAVSASVLKPLSFEGYKVLRVEIPSRESFDLLASLENVDFWREGRIGDSSDIMTSPIDLAKVTSFLDSNNFAFSVMIENIQDLIKLEQIPAPSHEVNKDARHNMDWTSYHKQDDIDGYTTYLAETYDFVDTESIGESYEGRKMQVLKVCKGGCGNKPAMWIDGGIHAREWISPASVTWMMKELVENDADHPHLTDKLDWFILPIVNPDGYAHTKSGALNRLWRKTRSNNGGTCLGVDANRNYGYMFNTGGSSDSKCSDTYHGPSAFSEKENANIRDFIMNRQDASEDNAKFVFFNSIHSYSQLVLLPWGFTSDPCPDFDDMMNLANTANEALKAVHGKNYDVGCIPCMLYIASGGSMDWAKATAGIKYSYGMELRDTGLYGFLLPPAQIIPTAEETWAFHRSAAEQILDEIESQ